MAISRTNAVKTKYSQEHRDNFSFDEDVQMNTVQIAEFDSNGIPYRRMTNNQTFRMDDTTTADVIYLGYAAIGSATSGAVWQIQKIGTSGGLAITWADGDPEFNNIWDNRASLTYN